MEASYLDRDKRSQKVNRRVLPEVVLEEEGRRLDGRVLDRSRFQPVPPLPNPGAISGRCSSKARDRAVVEETGQESRLIEVGTPEPAHMA